MRSIVGMSCPYIMPEQNGNSGIADDGSEISTHDLTYGQITESTVEELFDRFKKMRSEDRINVVSSICLAKALSNSAEIKHEDTRLEYLKEYGRNERAMLKSDGGGNSDDDDPLFAK